MWAYLKRLLVAIDQLLNVVFGGYEDETISSRLFRTSTANKYSMLGKNIVDTLLFFDNDYVNGVKIGHCEKSYNYELARMDLHPSMRG